MQTAQSIIEKIEEASVRRQTEREQLERDMLESWLQADLQIALEEAKKYEWVCLSKVYVVDNVYYNMNTSWKVIRM